ncbi:cellulase family glycosylhydrolase [Fibrobacter sp. UWEL]|uniref:cellulase family glycosylhydrolase n=1 Tax=Fibrobacter sp. UWEL TaxID=1896209 RepID=UPI00091BF96E|nr:cellulase family glycosylhydrolase [Fibrobacter sp. UWEL]SHL26320.1 Por secretion system C-terminal sorting domain-containing protein [Fibrobacter sp. UWEL]
MKKMFGLGMAILALSSMAFGRVGPVSQYGQLQAGKNANGKGQIYGACKGVTSGNEVQVQGMSLFWSISEADGGQYWTKDIVDGLVQKQNIQIIRAPMGVDEDWSEGNYFTKTNYHQGLMNNVVQAAIDNDIYVIIDYHSHHAHEGVENAKTFFKTMAEKYGKYDNVIFEIYNEPLEGTSWSSIKTYADQVISVIRTYSDNLIVVGTRAWDQYPNEALDNPINDKNVAYTFHFYAGEDPYRHTTSKEGANAVQAMNGGLSVFVTEWGTSAPSGNGGFTTSYNETWLSWMNQHKLSGANWSVSAKGETASYFNGSAWNYSESGQWVNSNVFSKLPTSYTACSGSSGELIPVIGGSAASSSSIEVPAGYTDYIDDFEDGDSLSYTGGVWYAYTDKDDGAKSSITNKTTTDKKGNSTGYQVVVTSDNGSKYMGALTGIKLDQGDYEYDPYVAMGVKLNADDSAYDLSSCKTISYKYKGAAHNFKAEDTAVKDYAYHYIKKSASTSWTQVNVSWDMLLQPTWTEDEVVLSQKRIAKFTWEVKGDQKGTQPSPDYLYVDDVRCDGLAIKPAVATPASSSSAKSSSSVASSSSAKSSSSKAPEPAEGSSSSSAKSSSSVASSSSVIQSSSSVAQPASSSAVVASEAKITGSLTQTVAKGGSFATITITGVTSFSRNTYNLHFLNIPQQASNGTVTISGTVPDYLQEGSLEETLTVNGKTVTIKLTVVAEGTLAVGRKTVASPLSMAVNGRTLQIAGANQMNVVVFDMQGRPVMNLKNTRGEVSLANLSTGSYIVCVHAGSANMMKRITLK